MKHIGQILPINIASIYRAKIRTSRRKDKKYLEWIRTQPCAICFRKPCEAAHQRILGGGGTGIKPPDYDALPLCDEHHTIEHTYGPVTLWNPYKDMKMSEIGLMSHLKEKVREIVSNHCDQHMMRYMNENLTQKDIKKNLAIYSHGLDNVSMQEVEQWVA